MPIEVVDDFGVWDDLGTVQPVFEDWLRFPDFTLSNSSLVRLFFNYTEFDYHTYGFVRCRYEVSNNFILGKWQRIYPKPQPDTILYQHPQDLLSINFDVKLFFEVMKRHRYRRRIGTITSSLWTVNLQVFNREKDSVNEQQQIVADFPTARFFNLL